MDRFTRSRLLLALVLGLSGCFVDEGECTSEGIDVDPCAVTVTSAGSIEITATVVGDPSQPVAWGVGGPEPLGGGCIQQNFDYQLTGPNSIRLFSKLALPLSSCSLEVVSLADPTRRATVSLGVSSVSHGYPPAPVQATGVDERGKQFAAVAAGGEVYYVAFADANEAPPPLPSSDDTLGPAVTNYYVKQFRLSDSQPLLTEPGQFEGFFLGGSVIVPNVAADCQGNGYWFDRASASAPFVLNRLAADGTLTSSTLSGFAAVGQVALTCNGTIFFLGRKVADFDRLYRVATIVAGGTTDVQEFVVTAIPGGIFQYDSLAIDAQGRLLLASRFPDGSLPLLRVVLDLFNPFIGSIDGTFDLCDTPALRGTSGCDLSGVAAVAVDAQGVVYAVDEGGTAPVIWALNEIGTLVYSISSYEDECTVGCAPNPCSFEDIVSLTVAADGRLRVVDDVVGGPCGETVRIILIDPVP